MANLIGIMGEPEVVKVHPFAISIQKKLITVIAMEKV